MGTISISMSNARTSAHSSMRRCDTASSSCQGGFHVLHVWSLDRNSCPSSVWKSAPEGKPRSPLPFILSLAAERTDLQCLCQQAKTILAPTETLATSGMVNADSPDSQAVSLTTVRLVRSSSKTPMQFKIACLEPFAILLGRRSQGRPFMRGADQVLLHNTQTQ